MTWLCDPARSGKASFFQMNVNVAHLVCYYAFLPGVGDDDAFSPRQGRKVFAPTGKMYWTYFETIAHSLNNLSPS